MIEPRAKEARPLPAPHPIDIEAATSRLREAGGYEIVHTSPGLELGVYVLVAPEPDRQQPHADDEVYVVLEGDGTLEIEGDRVDLHVGQAAFVPAGADHRFVGYEQLRVLVIFQKHE
jgi:mannose-6-phosphate isomerase-like protein (cupin superfamily)